MAEVIVREVGTGREVRRIPWDASSVRRHERALAGLLRNMDTDRYYADDSALDYLYRAAELPPTPTKVQNDE